MTSYLFIKPKRSMTIYVTQPSRKKRQLIAGTDDDTTLKWAEFMQKYKGGIGKVYQSWNGNGKSFITLLLIS